MAQSYRLAGSQNPESRIDRVRFESPSEEFPDGKVLELDGEPQELTDEQVVKLSTFVRLDPVNVKQEGEPAPIVDQPGVGLPSQSTDQPPDPGTLPDIESMNRDQLLEEANRIGLALPGNSKVDDIKKAINERRAQGV